MGFKERHQQESLSDAMKIFKNQCSESGRIICQKGNEFKERRAELDRQDVVYCPKCLSTQLSVGQKGFGIGNAAAGAFLTGNLLGLAAGAIGSKKIRITCLKCGHKFYPGKK